MVKKLDTKHKHHLMKLIKETHGTCESIESSHDFFNDGHIESEFFRMPYHLRGIISWASRQLKNQLKVAILKIIVCAHEIMIYHQMFL